MKIKAFDKQLARRLRTAGILIHVEDETKVPDDGLLIRQCAGVHESMAIAYREVATLVTLYLAITVDRPGFAISSFGLELPWGGSIRWLEDPREIDGRSRDYRFGFEGIPDFERDQVLNHLPNASGMISRGCTLKGCLLGVHDPMPDSFRHGEMIPAFVSIWDQFFVQYGRTVLLRAHRMQLPIRKSLAPRRNLLDRKDPDPVSKNRI